MHPTTKTVPRAYARRWAFLTLLGALLLLALAQAVPASAAVDYAGGPMAGDYPIYVANDHSVYAMRFTASGLDASTAYNVKIRISPTATPSGGTSRGFTWNPDTALWIQERDAWSAFPTITTDASGAYTPPSNTWTFFKFGDTTKPSAGSSSTWHIVVSLQPVGGGSGTTRNNADPPPVTIIDMAGSLAGATSAFRVHSGVATGAAASKRVEADAASLTDVWSLSRTEPNGVDEGYGTTATGDFDLAVPVGMPFDTKIQNVIWPLSALSFTGTQADVDIALGATDTAPPAAPADLVATIDDSTAHLSWDPVAEAASYTVYQWRDATPIDGAVNYTPQHMPIASVTGTSCDVSGIVLGEAYHFEVRAVDAATNIGPPSRYTAQLTLQTSASVVDWGGAATLAGELTDDSEPFAAGQQVGLEWSHDGMVWTLQEMLDPSATFVYGAEVAPTQKTHYRLVFEGDETHAAATSPTVTVTPRVKLGTPVAPKSVARGRSFAAFGSLTPKQAAGSKTVRIDCYLKASGKWRLRKTVTATNRNHGATSRYAATISLPISGSWKLIARSGATDKYAAATSGARLLKVK